MARRHLPFRFRTKLFLALGLLVAMALGAALMLVRSETERRVRDDFGERFERTLAAFRQLQALRRRTVADEVSAVGTFPPCSSASVAGRSRLRRAPARRAAHDGICAALAASVARGVARQHRRRERAGELSTRAANASAIPRLRRRSRRRR
jgi:hypothetical protein